MLKRIIPSSGESISAIGTGSWQNFDISASSRERKALKEILAIMDRHNAQLIDSSPMYGRSEEAIGDLTTETGLAEKFFYATKVWTSGRDVGISQMKDSMRKMRRTCMDLIQVHNLVDWKTHLATLRDWKSRRLVRYIGITHYTTSAHPQLAEILRKETLDFVQFNYSISTREAEQTLLPLAMDKGVAVIINEPLEKGHLFKKVKDKPLPGWAADYAISSWAAFFLKYIISHPAVTCVIPASSNPTHMEQNLEAGEGPLPDDSSRKKMAALIDAT